MKANLFAVAMLSFVVSIPGHSAAVQPVSNQVNTPAQKATATINLNKADAKTLAQSVKGIGKKRAEAIVKYREENGDFSSFEELAKVPGFGGQFVKNHLSQLQNVFTLN